ncbi:MAG: hypothetical protein GY915_02585, partial [bacterium]|nr:hypothetical protein [bacterium]
KAEMEKGTVTVRRLGSKEQEILALDEWIGKLKDEALPPSGQWL